MTWSDQTIMEYKPGNLVLGCAPDSKVGRATRYPNLVSSELLATASS